MKIERSWSIAPAVLLLSSLCACDPAVSYVVTRGTLVGTGCPDATRDFVITRQRSCCPDDGLDVEKGRITFGDGDYQREIFGDRKARFDHSSDYIDLYGGALGSPEVWARLQVTCPSTGAVVFDSGQVLREDAFCEQGKRFLFLFEGHARRGANDSCCPGELTCPR